jgi:uncharacterized membrane protein YphA (DoxX/SURF4 family)
MALAFKVMDVDGTAAYIASAGFPVPKLLAWLAALKASGDADGNLA